MMLGCFWLVLHATLLFRAWFGSFSPLENFQLAMFTSTDQDFDPQTTLHHICDLISVSNI